MLNAAHSGEVDAALRRLVLDTVAWRTDHLQVMAARRLLTPDDLPVSVRYCAGLAWRHMPAAAFSALVHRAVEDALSVRSVVVISAPQPCPRCGAPDAEVTVYDGGAYRRAEHPGPRTMGSPSSQLCYVGPKPLPEEYQGDHTMDTND